MTYVVSRAQHINHRDTTHMAKHRPHNVNGIYRLLGKDSC